MKKVLFLAAFVVLSGAAMCQQIPAAPPTGDVAAAEWKEVSYDFGKIKQGVPASHEFVVTNTGKFPLVITNATASCGCTKPEWTAEPILPGKTGHVKATFNAANAGAFDKTVTVTANIEQGFVQLKIKGEVSAQAVQ